MKLRLPRPWLLACALVAALAPAVVADIVTLATGAKIEGKVVYEDDQVVKIETKTGVQTFYRDDVLKVEKVADPGAEFERRKKALETSRAATSKAWYDLAAWAEEQKLGAQAKLALEKTIAVDPDHAGARRKLGYERVGKDWLPYAEAQKRKGLVEHQGRWVKPEEKEKLEQGYVQDINGEWVKKEVLEERKRLEEERQRKARDYEREQSRLARERAREKAEREGKPPPPPEKDGAEGEDGGESGGDGAGEEGGKAEPVDPGAIQFPTKDTLERWVTRQKADARGAEQFLGLKFEDVEEGPILIHTTHAKDSDKVRDFLKNLGKIYMAETGVYALKFEDPIWPGKLQIYFFKDKSQFDDFATRIDDAAGAVQSGGYFIHGGGAGAETKFHIVMYNLDLGTLAHEVSHAFMARYQLSPRVVAPWVNEGVAEFLRIYVSQSLELGQRDFRHRGLVKEMLARKDERVSLRAMMAKQDIAGTEGWAYAVSYTIIDFMIALDPGKGTRFVKFLKALKKGDGSFADRWSGAGPEEQQTAIETAFGVPLDKFDAAWKEHVRAYK